MRPSYLHRLTLRQIEIFLAVCRLRSYSRAAEELGLTQPAVSTQVRQLEHLVGEPLLNYVGRQVSLTPAGLVLESAARDLQQRLVGVEMELAELQGMVQGTLAIAAETSAQYFLPGLLADFRALYPAVHLQLEVVNHAAALRRVTENRDELVIMGLVPDNRAITFVPFRENRLIAVASARFAVGREGPLSLLDLTNETLLVREPGSGTRRIFEQYCLEQAVRFPNTQQLGSLESVKAGVLAGLGIAVIPLDACRSELELHELTELPVTGFPLRRSWCAIYPRGKNLTPVGQRFLGHLLSAGSPGDFGLKRG